MRDGDESGSGLAKLAYLYDSGHFGESVTLGESMLGAAGSADVRARISLFLAQSQLQLGKPSVAEAPLVAATRHFEGVGDAEMIVECMAAAAAVACLEQRTDALDLSMQALDACRSLEDVPRDLELRILRGLANAQLLVGRKREAIATLEEAISRADPVVDMRQLGKLHGTAAIAHRDIGQPESSVGYSLRAVALFKALHDLVSLAREENNLGCYLMACGRLTSARGHLERALRLFEKTDLQSGRASLLLSFCELCFAEGNLGEAMSHADAAIEAGASLNEVWSVANARMWKGRILARLGDDSGADDGFQRALAGLHDSGMTERLVECHFEYAEILEGRGDLRRAYEHFKAANEARPRGSTDRPVL